MSTVSLVPATESEWHALRAKCITSTEASALFGCSPYSTLFETWNRKKAAATVTIEPTARMRWGSRLQDAIAHGVAEDHGLTITAAREFIYDPETRIGSSFDFWADSDGILEVKNVDFLQYREGWIVDGDNVEAPAHIELQLQHQLLVSGRKFGYIAALISGNQVVLIRRDADPDIHAAIRSKVATFWASIDSNTPPPPQFPADADAVVRLHGYAEPGKVLNANGNQLITGLATQYKELSEVMKSAEDERKSVKAQLLLQIGDIEKVLGDGFTISAGVQGPAHVEAHDRAGFRRFGVTWKKVKP